MKIGLDFDNTIACYNQAIEVLAEKRFELPREIPRTKQGVKEYLRTNGREEEWTTFQGELYGPGMQCAKPFEGAITAMKLLNSYGHQLMIISHRSRFPYAGQQHDLHEAAHRWIKENLQKSSLFEEKTNVKNVHFLETREEKLKLIKQLSCEVFVDDLPEVLSSPSFASNIRAILFDPSGIAILPAKADRISSWEELPALMASFDR